MDGDGDGDGDGDEDEDSETGDVEGLAGSLSGLMIQRVGPGFKTLGESPCTPGRKIASTERKLILGGQMSSTEAFLDFTRLG